MTEALTVAGIATYLTAHDWHREPETWRAASIWTAPDGHQLLLPARDGMGDGDLRIRELLEVVALVEERPVPDIALEIATPMTDRQTYRLFIGGRRPEPSAPLLTSVRALNGIRQLLDSAGRALVEGPHVTFPGNTPRDVRDLLRGTRLSTAAHSATAFHLHLPLTEPENGSSRSPIARRIGVQLHDAVGSATEAAAEAGASGDLTAFDDAVTAGVSANLCQALSDLSGQDRREPFEIDFSWAYGLTSPLSPSTIRIDDDRGTVLARAARHLRQQNFTGEAFVSGLIESLHDDAHRADRWRVKMRGEVGGARGASARRTIWVRLHGPAAYDVAITAHREQLPVRAQGMLSVVAGRLELITDAEAFFLSG